MLIGGVNRKKSKMAAKITICTKWPVIIIWLVYLYRKLLYHIVSKEIFERPWSIELH